MADHKIEATTVDDNTLGPPISSESDTLFLKTLGPPISPTSIPESVSSDSSIPKSFVSDLEKLDLAQERLERYVDEVDESPCPDSGLKTNAAYVRTVNESYRSDPDSFKAKATKLREDAINKTLDSIKNSMSVDFCFVLDCTGSMQSYIAAAKDSILRIAECAKQANQSITIRVGFCGYRDHCDNTNRLQVFDFTDSYESFKSYLSSVQATGGGDTHEDVLGGLNAAVTRMSWHTGTRIIFHIGDCPPHGCRYGSYGDSRPNGDPFGLTAESVLGKMQSENIFYSFGKITNMTDKMIEIFQGILGQFQVLDLSSGDAISLVDKLSKASCSIITTSVSLTTTIGKTMDINAYWRNRRMNPTEPNWVNYSPYTAILMGYPVPKTVDDLKDSKYFRKSNIVTEKISYNISEQPFSVGAERFAYYGLDVTREPSQKKVIKEYVSIREGTNPIERYLEAVEISVVASYLSAAFNNATSPFGVKKIRFLEAKVLCNVADSSNTRYYTIESRLDGEFKRFNVNSGVIVDFRPCLEAFAHFTYEHTKKYLLLTDIQGIENADEFVLTDSAIHCTDTLRFGKTNLGGRGILKCFLENHKCNDICNNLGLRL
ncbi:9851_t:CDS:1 [Paraglomus brasilianum]|uniref:9851_t:CDS:1 n=1 Tax=Paraglomus brasilianum TaxID=144538 RepID=A0A9N9DCU1_9GLOM|nr:9851_t:CDS:1 [Paraglomus brasilianum]